jgi:hypothetical protein
VCPPSIVVSLDHEISNLVRVVFYLVAAAHLLLKFESFSQDFTCHDLCYVYFASDCEIQGIDTDQKNEG